MFIPYCSKVWDLINPKHWPIFGIDWIPNTDKNSGMLCAVFLINLNQMTPTNEVIRLFDVSQKLKVDIHLLF